MDQNFTIYYSTFDEGRETPHRISLNGSDKEDARHQLIKRLTEAGTTDYHIAEIIQSGPSCKQS